MFVKDWPSCCLLLLLTTTNPTKSADDDYNILHRDGSFQFGYHTQDSYHHAAGNRNNVVRGEFGGRNPSTGSIDSTQYTAGPRGFRPRGKNVHRKYDLNQNGPRPVGSRDDPYYDPYEDPSYNFQFKTRSYNRQENANRFGDVSGRYNYVDDVGEVHNVEYIAGKNTGFHVKTPFPDSNPRAYFGRLFFRGRGKPIPRGRTSIQRGLDGSYRFISAGPDQRRTETSDSTGHVRGSYTYLDDKGVQHSVHYIAGPETGYRVLKNVKGPHLPTEFPFGRPEIIPPDFYDYKDDVFDAAESGPLKPVDNSVANKPDKNERPGFDGDDVGPSGSGASGESGFDRPQQGGGGFSRPQTAGGGFSRPQTAGGGFSRPQPSGGGFSRPQPSGGGFSRPKPGGGSFSSGGGLDSDDDSDSDDFDGELFGPGSHPTKRPRPRPSADDGSYIPPGDVNQDDGSYRPGAEESGGEVPRPGFGSNKPPLDSEDYDDDASGLFGSESNSRPPLSGRPVIQIGQGGNEGDCKRCSGTIVTNLGDKLFSVPPGVSVRAHVQSIDLLPLSPKVPSPSERYKEEMSRSTEQLNSAASSLIRNGTATSEGEETTTTTAATVTTTTAEETTI